MIIMAEDKNKQERNAQSSKVQNITFATHSKEFTYSVNEFKKFIPLTFTPERNRLKWWHGLKKLKYGKTIVVGIFVDSKRLEEIEKGTNVPKDTYYWVFDWNEFEERCPKKGIEIDFKDEDNLAENLKAKKERLEKLLGIDTDIMPDIDKVAVCKLSIETNYLFRPAYNPMINDNSFNLLDGALKYTIQWPACNPDEDNNEDVLDDATKDEIEIKLAQLQKKEEYPWTRMGYTYDWGDKTNEDSAVEKKEPHYIGLSEFVIMPESPYKLLATYKFDN